MQLDQKLILHITDLHMDHSQLQSLKAYVLHFSKIYHLCLITGDIGNLPQSRTQEQESKSLKQIKQLISELNYLKCPMLLIPGNHDPSALFQNFQFGEKVIPLHKKWISIDGITFAGFGGSTPALNSESGQEVWSGYPFKNQQQYSKSFIPWVKSLPKQQPIILMTHMGPKSSQTTRNYSNEHFVIESGSPSLDSLSDVQNLKLNVHGHQHSGKGICYKNKVCIMNPGALRDGNVGQIELVRGVKGWNIQSTKLMKLSLLV